MNRRRRVRRRDRRTTYRQPRHLDRSHRLIRPAPPRPHLRPRPRVPGHQHFWHLPQTQATNLAYAGLARIPLFAFGFFALRLTGFRRRNFARQPGCRDPSKGRAVPTPYGRPARLLAVDLRMTDLARGLVLSRSGATYRIHQLVDAGLVERAQDPDDDRIVLVRLTAKGHDAVAVARPPTPHWFSGSCLMSLSATTSTCSPRSSTRSPSERVRPNAHRAAFARAGAFRPCRGPYGEGVPGAERAGPAQQDSGAAGNVSAVKAGPRHGSAGTGEPAAPEGRADQRSAAATHPHPTPLTDPRTTPPIDATHNAERTCRTTSARKPSVSQNAAYGFLATVTPVDPAATS